MKRDWNPRAASARARVRVVLVNYNTSSWIKGQLRTGVFRDDEVILVDNGSEPKEIQRLSEAHQVKCVLLETNLGFAEGVNAGVAASCDREAPILLLNPDVHIGAEDVRVLVESLNSDPLLTGVAPLLVDEYGRPIVGSAGGPLTLASTIGYFFGLSHLRHSTDGLFLTRSQLRTNRQVAWLCMACLLLRPTAFDEFGPLPTAELVYAEDVSWGTRASGLGARFLLHGDLTVTHIGGASGGASKWQGALERLMRRRLGGLRGVVAVLVVRVGLLTRRLARAVAAQQAYHPGR